MIQTQSKKRIIELPELEISRHTRLIVGDIINRLCGLVVLAFATWFVWFFFTTLPVIINLMSTLLIGVDFSGSGIGTAPTLMQTIISITPVFWLEGGFFVFVLLVFHATHILLKKKDLL